MTRFKFGSHPPQPVVWNPLPGNLLSIPELAALGGCLDALAAVPPDRRLAAVALFCRVFLDRVADRETEPLAALVKAITELS